MIGPKEKDYKVCAAFAVTLLRLRLVTIFRPDTFKMSSYVKVINMNQVYWSEYREKHEISN